jgi:hypothetical protein
MKCLAFTTILLFSFSFLHFAAADQNVIRTELCKIANTKNPGYYVLQALTDSANQLTGLRFFDPLIADSEVTLTIEDLTTENGAGIIVYAKVAAVKIKLENFNSQTGGTLKFIYLFNGLALDYKSISLQISRQTEDGKTVWLLHDESKLVNTIIMKAAMFGISSMTPVREATP